MYIHNIDLPLNSRPMYPTAFSIFLLDVKWASHTYHAQLKTLALLVPNDFSIIFLVYMNDSSIFQHLKPINLKSNPSLLFFSLSLPDPNPIANYLGSSVYLHTEARTIFNNRLYQSYKGIFSTSSFTQQISLYYDLQNLSNQVAHYHFLSCPSSLWFCTLLSATIVYFDVLYTERTSLPQWFCICCSLSSKLLAPYIHMVNSLTLFMSFSSVTFW